MQIQKGVVKYKDRSDIICSYGIVEDGKQYYFLNPEGLPNGNIIVSSELIEAIDPLVKASHVGLIDKDGKVIMPLENKSIKQISDNIILVELSTPISPNVVESLKSEKDPLAATRFVATAAAIKDKINSKIGTEGKFVFNNQFSEATICDLNGNNLIDDEYYSFIGVTNDKVYFSKNIIDSPITEYSILPPEAQNSDLNNPVVNVEAIDREAIGGAIDHEMKKQEEAINNPDVVDKPSVEEKDDLIEGENKQLNKDDSSEKLNEVKNEDVEAKKESFDIFTPPIVSEEKAIAEQKENENNEVVSFSEPVKTEVSQVVDKNDIALNNVEDKNDMLPKNNNIFAPLETIDKEPEKDALKVEESIVEKEKIEEKKLDNDFFDLKPASHEEKPVEVKEEKNDLDSTLDAISNVFPNVEKKPETFETDFIPDLKRKEDERVKKSDTSMDLFSSKNGIDVEPEEEVFRDSILKEEKIVPFPSSIDYGDSDLDYSSSTNYSAPSSFKGNDNVLVDVAKSMSSLIELNRKQKSIINDYEIRLDKVNNSRKNLVEKTRNQEQTIDALNAKLRNYETIVTKLESQAQLLDSRVHDQNRIIESQSRELESLRPQVKGKEELIKLLADAQTLLGQEDYSTPIGEDYYRRMVA